MFNFYAFKDKIQLDFEFSTNKLDPPPTKSALSDILIKTINEGKRIIENNLPIKVKNIALKKSNRLVGQKFSTGVPLATNIIYETYPSLDNYLNDKLKDQIIIEKENIENKYNKLINKLQS